MILCKLDVLFVMLISKLAKVPTVIVVYESFQTWMSSPFRVTSLPVNKLFHIQELHGFAVTFEKGTFLQYLRISIEAIRDFGFVKIL